MENKKNAIVSLVQEFVEFRIEESHFNEPFDSLGVDSLMMLEVAVDIERDFDIHISDEDLSEISTLSDLIEIINKG